MRVNNPYSEIIGLMMEQGSKYNPPSIQLAEVLVPPPDLIIKMGDIQVDKNNILIADYLLKEYKRSYYANGKIVFNDSDCGTTDSYICGHTSQTHSHKVVSVKIDTEDYSVEGKGKDDGKYLWFKDTVEKGDLLAVMPTCDMQMYIVLSRVVKPDAYE